LIAAVRLSSSALSMVGADRARIGSRAILFLFCSVRWGRRCSFSPCPARHSTHSTSRSILLPYLTYYRDSLAAGEFPFWNPYASLGRPFAADPQALVFLAGHARYLGLGVFLGNGAAAWGSRLGGRLVHGAALSAARCHARAGHCARDWLSC